jgi:hypothetical protein
MSVSVPINKYILKSKTGSIAIHKHTHTMSKTKAEVFTEKLGNFKAFLQKQFGVSDQTIAESPSIEEVYSLIKHALIPHLAFLEEGELPSEGKVILQKFGIDLESASSGDRDKFFRYLELLCKIIK